MLHVVSQNPELLYLGGPFTALLIGLGIFAGRGN
jgi:hypothetical protein